jgi:hypothetical protein
MSLLRRLRFRIGALFWTTVLGWRNLFRAGKYLMYLDADARSDQRFLNSCSVVFQHPLELRLMADRR